MRYWFATILTLSVSCVWADDQIVPSTYETPQDSPETVQTDADIDVIFEALSSPTTSRRHLGIYLMHLESGNVVPIVDRAQDEFTYFGSPQFSPDGSAIVYDATPDKNFSQSHMFLLKWSTGGVDRIDLGPGNCPAFSPDGKSIAFLLNPGTGLPGTPGLWIMNVDGSRRQRLTDGSIPEWSPGGAQILNASFGSPVRVEMVDAGDGRSESFSFDAGRDIRFYSIPNWVDANTMVALTVEPDSERIALVDVSNVGDVSIKETLLETRETPWHKTIAHPVYSATTGECVFVHRTDDGMALYRVQEGGDPQALEGDRRDNHIAGLFMDPKGKYLLFCSDRDSPSITKQTSWPRNYEQEFGSSQTEAVQSALESATPVNDVVEGQDAETEEREEPVFRSGGIEMLR